MLPLIRLARGLGLLSLFVLCSCSSGHGLQSLHAPAPRAGVSCEDSGNLAAKLGATLFFDARLSGDRSLACASCHDPELQFTDGKVLAIGFAGKELLRHSPSLVNLGRGRSFFWDGRERTLEGQARAVIENPDELNSNLDLVVERLKSVPHYEDRFAAIFPGRGITSESVLTSLAEFERNITALESSFDRFRAGDSDALTAAERRGFSLFHGAALCSKCHSGSDFTDREFHNTGVETDDVGRIAVVRNTRFEMRPYPFFGNHKAFKTPSLRNVARTAPYFHNGSVAALEDVVRFYNVGGRAADHYGRSPDVRELGLNEQQIKDLVDFLGSLSSELDYCAPIESVIVSAPAPR